MSRSRSRFRAARRSPRRTLNARLGIVGGLSILGTTGIVVPYSCSAWIDSIHRGIDVARAAGLDHVAGATGSTSEAAVQRALRPARDGAHRHGRFRRRHAEISPPAPRAASVTIAGGFAKMTKLAPGPARPAFASAAPSISRWLAARFAEAGGDAATARARLRAANTAREAFELARAAGVDLGAAVAEAAWAPPRRRSRGTEIALEVAVFDRAGLLVGRDAVSRRSSLAALPPRKRRR